MMMMMMMTTTMKMAMMMITEQTEGSHIEAVSDEILAMLIR